MCMIETPSLISDQSCGPPNEAPPDSWLFPCVCANLSLFWHQAFLPITEPELSWPKSLSGNHFRDGKKEEENDEVTFIVSCPAASSSSTSLCGPRRSENERERERWGNALSIWPGADVNNSFVELMCLGSNPSLYTLRSLKSANI